MMSSPVEWVSRLHENEVSGEEFREADSGGEGTAGAKPWRRGCHWCIQGTSVTPERSRGGHRGDGSQITQGLVGHCRNLGVCYVC